ncbi:MAG: hypothetical protein ACRYGR_06455, partial [Janthinobacterium lividum]
MLQYKRSSPILTKSNLQNIKRKFNVPNPPTFRDASSEMKISKSMINRAVKENLEMKKKKKIKLHRLNQHEMKNR